MRRAALALALAASLGAALPAWAQDTGTVCTLRDGLILGQPMPVTYRLTLDPPELAAQTARSALDDFASDVAPQIFRAPLDAAGGIRGTVVEVERRMDGVDGGSGGRSGQASETRPAPVPATPTPQIPRWVEVNMTFRWVFQTGDRALVTLEPAGDAGFTRSTNLEQDEIVRAVTQITAQRNHLRRWSARLTHDQSLKLIRGTAPGVKPPEVQGDLVQTKPFAQIAFPSECAGLFRMRQRLATLQGLLSASQSRAARLQRSVQKAKKDSWVARNLSMPYLFSNSFVTRAERTIKRERALQASLRTQIKQVQRAVNARGRRIEQDQHAREMAKIKSDPASRRAETRKRETAMLASGRQLAQLRWQTTQGNLLYQHRLTLIDGMRAALARNRSMAEVLDTDELEVARRRIIASQASWQTAMDRMQARHVRDQVRMARENLRDGIGPTQSAQQLLIDRGKPKGIASLLTQADRDRGWALAARRVEADSRPRGDATSPRQFSLHEFLSDAVDNTVHPSVYGRRISAFAIGGSDAVAQFLPGLLKLGIGTTKLINQARAAINEEWFGATPDPRAQTDVIDSLGKAVSYMTETDRKKFEADASKLANGLMRKFDAMAAKGETEVLKALSMAGFGTAILMNADASVMARWIRAGKALHSVVVPQRLRRATGAGRVAEAAPDAAAAQRLAAQDLPTTARAPEPAAAPARAEGAGQPAPTVDPTPAPQSPTRSPDPDASTPARSEAAAPPSRAEAAEAPKPGDGPVAQADAPAARAEAPEAKTPEASPTSETPAPPRTEPTGPGDTPKVATPEGPAATRPATEPQAVARAETPPAQNAPPTARADDPRPTMRIGPRLEPTPPATASAAPPPPPLAPLPQRAPAAAARAEDARLTARAGPPVDAAPRAPPLARLPEPNPAAAARAEDARLTARIGPPVDAAPTAPPLARLPEPNPTVAARAEDARLTARVGPALDATPPAPSLARLPEPNPTTAARAEDARLTARLGPPVDAATPAPPLARLPEPNPTVAARAEDAQLTARVGPALDATPPAPSLARLPEPNPAAAARAEDARVTARVGPALDAATPAPPLARLPEPNPAAAARAEDARVTARVGPPVDATPPAPPLARLPEPNPAAAARAEDARLTARVGPPVDATPPAPPLARLPEPYPAAAARAEDAQITARLGPPVNAAPPATPLARLPETNPAAAARAEDAQVTARLGPPVDATPPAPPLARLPEPNPAAAARAEDAQVTARLGPALDIAPDAPRSLSGDAFDAALTRPDTAIPAPLQSVLDGPSALSPFQKGLLQDLARNGGHPADIAALAHFEGGIPFERLIGPDLVDPLDLRRALAQRYSFASSLDRADALREIDSISARTAEALSDLGVNPEAVKLAQVKLAQDGSDYAAAAVAYSNNVNPFDLVATNRFSEQGLDRVLREYLKRERGVLSPNAQRRAADDWFGRPEARLPYNVTRPDGSVVRAPDSLAGHDLLIRDGDELVSTLKVGEHLGDGSTSAAYRHRDNPDLVVRVNHTPGTTLPNGKSVTLEDLQRAQVLDEAGRRALNATAADSAYIEPIKVFESHLLTEGHRAELVALAPGQQANLRLEGRVREALGPEYARYQDLAARRNALPEADKAALAALETQARSARRFDEDEAHAIAGALDDLNAKGYVVLDGHTSNFSLVGNGDDMRVAFLDPGGIVPVMGLDPAVARRLQAAVLKQDAEAIALYQRVSEKVRTQLANDAGTDFVRQFKDHINFGELRGPTPVTPDSLSFKPSIGFENPEVLEALEALIP